MTFIIKTETQYKILCRDYMTAKDIQTLLQCSRATAYRLLRAIGGSSTVRDELHRSRYRVIPRRMAKSHPLLQHVRPLGNPNFRKPEYQSAVRRRALDKATK